MTSVELTQLILTGATGTSVLGVGFWLKRWVDRTDRKLDTIQATIVKVQCENAVTEEKVSRLEINQTNLKKKVEEIADKANLAVFRMEALTQGHT